MGGHPGGEKRREETHSWHLSTPVWSCLAGTCSGLSDGMFTNLVALAKSDVKCKSTCNNSSHRTSGTAGGGVCGYLRPGKRNKEDCPLGAARWEGGRSRYKPLQPEDVTTAPPHPLSSASAPELNPRESRGPLTRPNRGQSSAG